MERLNWSCGRWKVWDLPSAKVRLCHFLGQEKYRPGTSSVLDTARSGGSSSILLPTHWPFRGIKKASALPSIAIPFLQASLTPGEAKPPWQNSFPGITLTHCNPTMVVLKRFFKIISFPYTGKGWKGNIFLWKDSYFFLCWKEGYFSWTS